MPRCKVCGSTRSFGSSKVSPAAQYANGPLSGMIGEFDASGRILQVSSQGADKTMIHSAVDQPEFYFDFCLCCGSKDIEWTTNISC